MQKQFNQRQQQQHQACHASWPTEDEGEKSQACGLKTTPHCSPYQCTQLIVMTIIMIIRNPRQWSIA
jgi:hypothetical protein